MRSKLVVALLAVSVMALGFGCGKGSDPAGEAVNDFFLTYASGSATNAFPKYAFSGELNGTTLKSWNQTFSGSMGGTIVESKYFDSSGAECAPAGAVKADVHYSTYIGGAISKANKVIWVMKCEKEKDKAGNDVWHIHFPQCKMK